MNHRNPDNGRKWKDSCAVVAVMLISGTTLLATGIGYWIWG